MSVEWQRNWLHLNLGTSVSFKSLITIVLIIFSQNTQKMKRLYILSFLLAFSFSAKSQSSPDDFLSANYRESVFTDDLKYVFVMRKENLGNVFIYDVVSNTMIKELNSTNGAILKVIPKTDYFLLVTVNALEVYDLKTFGKYYDLPYDYQKVDSRTVKKMEGKSSDDETFAKASPEWMQIDVQVSNEYLACKWDDGKAKLWNWKTKGLLLDKNLTKGAFGIMSGGFSFGTNPARILYQDEKRMTLYDSTLKVLASQKFENTKYPYFFFNDVDNQVVIVSTDLNIISWSATSTTYSYKEDLTTVVSTTERKFSLKETKESTIGTFGDKVVSELFVQAEKLEDEYKNFDHNLRKVVIQDAKTGKEIFTIQGAYSSVSPDGSRLIVKRVKGDMPEYKVGKYKKFFKKKASLLKGNRYSYKYKKSVEAITYQQIIDLSTGKEIATINTADPLYFFKSIYILQNSNENGGLKLYDYTNGTLIKEI